MRKARALAVLLVLVAACTVPAGTEVAVCDASWREIDSRVVIPGGEDPRRLAIDCMRPVDERRVRIGFLMPAGPSCYRLSELRVVESADAVSFTLVASREDDPAAGACPEEAVRTTTEVDLQAPVADRVLLDGSSGSD